VVIGDIEFSRADSKYVVGRLDQRVGDCADVFDRAPADLVIKDLDPGRSLGSGAWVGLRSASIARVDGLIRDMVDREDVDGLARWLLRVRYNVNAVGYKRPVEIFKREPLVLARLQVCIAINQLVCSPVPTTCP
jgi:hypothetical protein